MGLEDFGGTSEQRIFTGGPEHGGGGGVEMVSCR